MFTIIIEHGKDDGHGGMAVTIGKLRLVDLAGSERFFYTIVKLIRNVVFREGTCNDEFCTANIIQILHK